MSLRPIALYIHWPFCKSKCPYCDFNSHVRARIEEEAWEKAYIADLRHFHRLTQGRPLTSVFFGGGTPSLMSPQLVAALLEEVHALWGIQASTEITLEANPNSIEQERFQGFKAAGVNRLSVGIQSLQPEVLKFLGRTHSADEARRALAVVASIFDNYSFDLMYTHPHHTVEGWRQELQEALSLGRSHFSLYQLTIEPGTPFYLAHGRGEWTLPDEETSALFYETTTDIMESAGFEAYEVSNYAKPGFESRHNLTYWNYGDYIGVGPGAHGRLTLQQQKVAFRQHRAPEKWLELVTEKGTGIKEEIVLSQEEVFKERLLMGVRLKQGIPYDILGSDFWKKVGPEKQQALLEAGYITPNPHVLEMTPEGRLRLNRVLEYLTSIRL